LSAPATFGGIPSETYSYPPEAGVILHPDELALEPASTSLGASTRAEGIWRGDWGRNGDPSQGLPYIVPETDSGTQTISTALN